MRITPESRAKESGIKVIVFITANERKETRGLHIRPDYLFTDSLLDKLLIVEKIGKKLFMEWREIRRMIGINYATCHRAK